MPRLSFQLKGWKQIVIALAIVVGSFVGYTLFLRNGLEPRLKPLIEERLKVDLRREALERTIPNAGKASPTRTQSEKYLEENNKVDGVKILSIEKRGWGSRLVAKVKFKFDDDASPEETRYYRLKFGWLTGWYVWSSVSEFSYQTGWL